MIEVFCLASGPSLTPADVERVRSWRSHDRLVYAVNNTHELAPWADLLFAGDGKWLDRYAAGLTFHGERVTASQKGLALGWEVTPQGFQWYQNSGCGAIAWAIKEGAKRVYLLGYDCRAANGKTHWHGSHALPLKDAPNMGNWPTMFVQVANAAKHVGVEIINCTRDTALKCFPMAPLESVAIAEAFS